MTTATVLPLGRTPRGGWVAVVAVIAPGAVTAIALLTDGLVGHVKAVSVTPASRGWVFAASGRQWAAQSLAGFLAPSFSLRLLELITLHLALALHLDACPRRAMEDAGRLIVGRLSLRLINPQPLPLELVVT